MTCRGPIAAVAIAIVVCTVTPASAHSLDIAVVDVRELSLGTISIAVVASTSATALESPIDVELPAGCAAEPRETLVVGDGQLSARWLARCQGPLRGETIVVRWTRSAGNAMVHVHLSGGQIVSRLVSASDPEVDLSGGPDEAFFEAARRYFVLGVRHIAGGLDHLLFVFGLILLCRRRSVLLATVTAFTVGHSATLALATLGVVTVPSAPVEAVIALSIVFVAVELAGPTDDQSSMRRRPYLFAAAFGLLHGLGFAGALTEIGVSTDTIVPALLGFNVGVEAGQLAFVSAVLATAWVGRLMVEPPAWTVRALAYPIGAVSSMWLLDRVAAF